MPAPVSGLDLSRRFFMAEGLPMLRRRFPELLPHIAAGRVGEGSECFGFDDRFSRDHDFGPGFCLWIEDSLWEEHGDALRAAYQELPAVFEGVPRPAAGPFSGRVGAFPIDRFYGQFLGGRGIPRTVDQWFSVPQEPLAVCTNGAVFFDPSGDFTAVREHLLSYYPEQVRLKKLAAHCALASQAGQYNYGRCVRRGEHAASVWALGQFLYHYMAAVFLMNRRYMPFGKWAPRAFRSLPVVGEAAAPLLEGLTPAAPDTEAQIEQLCRMLIAELNREGLSPVPGSFLLEHGSYIQRHLSHPGLASLPLMSWRSGWQ